MMIAIWPAFASRRRGATGAHLFFSTGSHTMRRSEPCMPTRATIGIDLGGTNIKGGVVAPSGEVTCRRSIETEAAGGFQHVFDRLVGLIRDLRRDAESDGAARPAIGIGVPGPMSHK